MRRTTTAAVRSAAIIACGAASLLALSGCNSPEGRAALIRGNLTPGLTGLSDRKVDQKNRQAIVNDTNLRSFNEDLERFLFLDRPSIVSPTPIPY